MLCLLTGRKEVGRKGRREGGWKDRRKGGKKKGRKKGRQAGGRQAAECLWNPKLSTRVRSQVAGDHHFFEADFKVRTGEREAQDGLELE